MTCGVAGARSTTTAPCPRLVVAAVCAWAAREQAQTIAKTAANRLCKTNIVKVFDRTPLKVYQIRFVADPAGKNEFVVVSRCEPKLTTGNETARGVPRPSSILILSS